MTHVFEVNDDFVRTKSLPKMEMVLKKCSAVFCRGRKRNEAEDACDAKDEGTLEDGRVVAVKSPRGLHPNGQDIDYFLNQVVIKQIINHKNVAKLHGCCLETRVPTLVYEFLPNFTLFDQIHGRDGSNSIAAFNIPWSKLVKIAAETSHALSYMHMALAKPIIHMDVKPSNIYLDESFTAKLTNFGFSVSISPGEDFISQIAVGTFAYMDPDYCITLRVTEKCDVYSFGVTLMELLTGKNPMVFVEQCSHLVDYFVWHMQQNQVLGIVHPRVLREAATEETLAFARLAVRCAARRGEERPTMREVAIELRQIHHAAKRRCSIALGRIELRPWLGLCNYAIVREQLIIKQVISSLFSRVKCWPQCVVASRDKPIRLMWESSQPYNPFGIYWCDI
ncbi:hypothetical protein CRG98_024100 [Punica granatum]|uniref:Protein kinase domain-containing protein n=1 Tax=Punica granatum TaxID=22663 RepID=A0A2I0JGV5_PUNGR|nr:hypothetical protein CRG98_024100 [Punica granatum]